MRFRRSLFFSTGTILLACGTVSAGQKPISAVVAIQDLDKAGLIARAIQSGEDSLEAMRTLTCRQRIDVYEHGKFRDSNEFDVDFHNGSEHYSNFSGVGHPRDVASEDELKVSGFI